MIKFYKNKKGFTLIELLITISIIGVLSALAVNQLNSSRAKARDVKRISDVRNMMDALRYVVLDNPTAALVDPCHVEDTSVLECDNTNGDQPGDIETQFIKYIDPSFADAASANGNPCNGGGLLPDTEPCQYSIGNNGATVSDVIIQFYLEKGAGELGAGPHYVESGVFY